MDGRNNQKLKLLYIIKILSEQTDENNGLTLAQIASMLKAYEVTADRKTLYTDFEELRKFGYDITSYQEGRSHYYQLVSRDFELAELKLLVDTVQSAKFITEKKSRELIKKLENLVSTNEARQLHRQVILSGRVKTVNESIYYNVDRLHAAIASNSKITFQYYQWNERKEMVLRHNGELYHVSPWALIWDDEYYYMIAYDSDADKFKHYRVDKMLKITATGEAREGESSYKDFNLAKYTRGLFGMFGGEEVKVTLLCKNWMAGIIIDRFGKDHIFVPVDGDHFEVTVDVSLSDQFLGWVASLSSGLEIVGPDSVIDAMKDMADRLANQYLDF